MFDFLLTRARVAVPADSLRLSVAGRLCGWVAADVPALLAGQVPDVVVRQGMLGCLDRLAPGAARGEWPLTAVNELLACMASRLSAAGRLNGWRGELLDVVDTQGAVIGVIERSAVRPLGIATHAVHLNAWTPAGELWIAQRALSKNTDPGKWDTLVGGLISAGETPEYALGRESWEEAGLPAPLLEHGERVGSFQVERVLPEGYQIEIVSVVDKVLPEDVVPVNQDGEVALIRQAPVAEVLDMVAQDRFTLEAALSLLLSMQARGIDTGVSPRRLARFLRA